MNTPGLLGHVRKGVFSRRYMGSDGNSIFKAVRFTVSNGIYIYIRKIYVYTFFISEPRSDVTIFNSSDYVQNS